MMKTLVIYKSKSGFTKTYAEWIAQELTADLMEASTIKTEIFSSYDSVVYGAGLYAVGLNGIKLITENMDKLEGKKVAVFATGATPPRENDIASVRDMNFTPEQLNKIRFFYMRGGFNFSKLTPVDKVLMILLKLKIKLKASLKKKLVPDEIGMLAGYDKPLDFTQRKNIQELVAYIKS